MTPTHITAYFEQEADGNDVHRDTQRLTITATQRDGGPYLVLETQRWALDDPDELRDTLSVFEGAVSHLLMETD
jgi:hypothetical protein